MISSEIRPAMREWRVLDDPSLSDHRYISYYRLTNGKSEYLGRFATVYQAEVVAVMRCVEDLIEKNAKHDHIVIFTDSQATVRTMEKSSYKSAVALECFDRLNELASVNRRVVLCWCPGHRGIPGNEEADRLAKLIVEEKRPGMEPWLPVPYADFKLQLKRLSLSRLKERWSSTTTCRQGREMIGEINVGRVKEILRMNRGDSRILTYILTGHAPLNYHLYKMGVRENGNCTCETNEPQTVRHLLVDCDRFVRKRREVFGLLDFKDQRVDQLPYDKLIRFFKEIDQWDKTIGSPT
ncbi:uncharacterized protein LOC108630038 [Ceratina calcarata]|uniref:Uncharacterized protein LOC108630038 n=1 Tax=Ceratina calcarata TaxID=156304 RepID=A0AAJ7JBF9_9HYME|nr:uncharacterized protein LOC108630038 [Ceratina calcarata]